MTKTVTVSETSASATPVNPTIAARAHEFVQFACARCHGEQALVAYLKTLKG